MRKIKMPALASTTRPGFTNPNGQVVMRDTGVQSPSFPGQRIYELRCSQCELRYGANGTDLLKRLCPGCQHGAPGELVREPGPRLFD